MEGIVSWGDPSFHAFYDHFSCEPGSYPRSYGAFLISFCLNERFGIRFASARVKIAPSRRVWISLHCSEPNVSSNLCRKTRPPSRLHGCSHSCTRHHCRSRVESYQPPETAPQVLPYRRDQEMATGLDDPEVSQAKLFHHGKSRTFGSDMAEVSALLCALLDSVEDALFAGNSLLRLHTSLGMPSLAILLNQSSIDLVSHTFSACSLTLAFSFRVLPCLRPPERLSQLYQCVSRHARELERSGLGPSSLHGNRHGPSQFESHCLQKHDRTQRQRFLR